MSNIIHQIGTCMDCKWFCDDYRNSTARKQAKAHAKKTGHRIVGETGISWGYNNPHKSLKSQNAK